jgi:hypothetical protein
MKIAPILATMVCLSILTGYRASGQDTNKIPVPSLGGGLSPKIRFRLNLENASVGEILKLYKGEARCELVVASDVLRARQVITLHAAEDVSSNVAMQMIEQALLKQAGIVITRLDAKRVSVTYNDQLELEIPKTAPKPSPPAI